MSEESKNIEENLITEESNIENVPLDQLDQLDPEQLAKLGYEIVKKTEADVARDESLLLKSGEGDLEAVKALLKEGADVWHRDEAGKSPLHAACSGGHLKVVNELLQAGHQWNAVDNSGKSTGEYASENGHDQVYERLIEEGCRVELILGVIDRKDEKEEEAANKDYLSQPLIYEDEKLLDAEKNGVMMGWEKPLMERHAKIICPSEGLDVLNVGFGLGLIDDEIQKYKPRTHTIIEAHPDVYAHMLKLGWDKKPGVRILFGRWQDVMDQIEHAFDGIFFDTFGEFYADLREFHEYVPNILKDDGIYSFFNGLGATNQFFHDVYCRVAEIDLRGMGLVTEYVPINIDPSADQIWEGVKDRYWTLNEYRLPICRFMD